MPIRVNDDADDQPIRVKLTAADGTVSLSTTVGTQFQANSNTADQQINAAAAMTPDGGFVLVWQSNNQDDDGYGIFAQRYDADGSGARVPSSRSTPCFTSTRPIRPWRSPTTAASSWSGSARTRTATTKASSASASMPTGERLGAEFQVNTYTNKAQITPDIAMDATGRFVVVWASDDQDGDDYGVFGQVFDAAGAKVGAEFQVNVTTARHQQAPAVAMDQDGDFVVAWQSEVAGDNKWDILARRFDADGVGQGRRRDPGQQHQRPDAAGARCGHGRRAATSWWSGRARTSTTRTVSTASSSAASTPTARR